MAGLSGPECYGKFRNGGVLTGLDVASLVTNAVTTSPKQPTNATKMSIETRTQTLP